MQAPGFAPRADRVLIWPVLSTAMAPQLAVDLLTNRSDSFLSRVSSIETEYVLPVAGCDALAFSASAGVSTALDVFATGDSQIVVVQQRSPWLPSCHFEAAEALIGLAKEWGVSRIVFLCSSESAWRTDAQISGPQWRWESTAPSSGASPVSGSDTVLTALDGTELNDWPRLESAAARHVLKPGSFLDVVWHLLSELQDSKDVAGPCPEGVLIDTFCTEGAAPGQDAGRLASLTLAYLGRHATLVEANAWRTPASWANLAGPGVRAAIF